MAFDFRLPDIKGTDREQLKQIRSYLYQLIPQLQFALNNMGTTSTVVYETHKTAGTPSQSSSSLDAEVAFEALKPLIIKSADIVQAYYEEINSMIVGSYVAQSDFGTFSEQMEQRISKSSTDIEQAFKNIQQIFSDIDNISFTLAEVNAHIRSGLLYYNENEIPVYGLEIGQKTYIDGAEVFSKYARFTSDRLSFYDQNDKEVAYISDYKLYIRSLEITERSKMGGYVETVTSDGGIIEKWVGW